MKVLTYMQSLLPTIFKDDVRRNLEDLRAELRDQTIPPYENASNVFKNFTFKDKFVVEFDRRFAKEVDSRFKGNFIQVTTELLKRALENITVIEKHIDTGGGKDIVKAALTFDKAQVLQLVEALGFVSKYARKLLIYTLSVETDMVRHSKIIKKAMTPAEMKWLADSRSVFFHALRALEKTPRELDQVLKNIPVVEIDADNLPNVVAAVGVKNLDPLGLSVHGLVMNPIYHVRIAYTEWQVNRLDAAQEELRVLEYQIMDLENALAQKHDPTLEKALEYAQNRASKLNHKIQKMEEDAR